MVQDVKWKSYFSDDERYADIINGIACQGRQIVTQRDLQELDTQTGFLHGMKFVRRQQRRKVRIRDTVRKTAFGINFAIIGIESQEVTDYSIPLWNMSYDVGMYEKQAVGIRKESRLYPVITFILYSGDEWDGPVSLHGILDFTDIPDGLREMVSDYKINLIAIKKIEDTSVFKTDVRQVFDFIRCSEDKKALWNLVANDSYYKKMEEDAFDVVAHYTNAAELAEVKSYYGKDGKVDMCKAIKDLIEEGREEGMRQEAERFNQLIIILSEQGRMEELVKAAKSKTYREQLFRKELHL